MLKGIITRIKKQKETPQSNMTQKVQKEKQIITYQSIPSLLDCDQGHQVNHKVDRIRYFLIEGIPQFFSNILHCNISSFHSLPFGKRKVKQINLLQDNQPKYISILKELILKQVANFNHVLVNIYPPGIGIMPHYDGPAYYPKVFVLSLGGPAIINFQSGYSKQEKSVCSILLEDKSVHVFEGQAYNSYLHGIEDLVYESIFIKIKQKGQSNQIEFENASVCNFNQTKLKTILEKKIISLGKDFQKLNQIDISKEVGISEAVILKIEENENYNIKIELKRQERISLTVRERFEPS